MESNEEKLEVWKDIPGYIGMYQVSNLGRVKSLSRKIEYKSWPYFRVTKDVILKQSQNSNGYFHVCLYDLNRVKKTMRIHQLVAICFLNHSPNGNNMVVDHINGDKKDNRLENINVIHNRINISKGMRPNEYTGVHERRGRFRSMIRVNNKLVHLGTYNTKEEASKVYLNYLEKNIL